MHRTKFNFVLAILALTVTGLPTAGAAAKTSAGNDLKARFSYLKTHGNSECSQAFMASIASMPSGARLQGSCCSPMVLNRYIQQVRGLKKYANMPQIPSDPYDIAAGLARKMMAAYGTKLNPVQQAAYAYAMQHSAEKGPCCCKCWRWRAYGGLAKLLIRDHGFTGPQVTQVWNLSDGCGGKG
jgi:hypothetical protein